MQEFIRKGDDTCKLSWHVIGLGTFNMPTYWLNFQSVSYKGALNFLYPQAGRISRESLPQYK